MQQKSLSHIIQKSVQFATRLFTIEMRPPGHPRPRKFIPDNSNPRKVVLGDEPDNISPGSSVLTFLIYHPEVSIKIHLAFSKNHVTL